MFDICGYLWVFLWLHRPRRIYSTPDGCPIYLISRSCLSVGQNSMTGKPLRLTPLRDCPWKPWFPEKKRKPIQWQFIVLLWDVCFHASQGFYYQFVMYYLKMLQSCRHFKTVCSGMLLNESPSPPLPFLAHWGFEHSQKKGETCLRESDMASWEIPYRCWMWKSSIMGPDNPTC